MKSKKGSALLVAILLSAILLALVGALVTVAFNEYKGSQKSYYDTAAFSLAESGVDRAAAFIASGGIANAVTTEPTSVTNEAGVWYKKMNGATVDYYRGYFPVVDLANNRKGTCSVIVEPGVASGNTTQYSVYTLGAVRGGNSSKGLASQRAIQVRLDTSTTTGGGKGAALAAQESLEFGSGANENPFDAKSRFAHLLVASYDSSLNNGRADMTVDMTTGLITGTNYGDAAMVGLKATNGTATLYGGLIYGTVALGGTQTTLSLTSNPKAGASATEWPSHNPYACCVIDLAAAQKYYTSGTATTKSYAYMGYNMDLDGASTFGDNVVYNYKFDASLFALNGFNKDTNGVYTTFDTTNYTAKSAINGNNNDVIASQNANVTKTVLGPDNYKAGDNTKTVAYLENVQGLGEILVKGDAVLILSGGANAGNGDGVKISYADNTSKLTIVLSDSSTYTVKFANADNNISKQDNLQTETENPSGVGYKPERLTITSSQSPTYIMRIGSQQDAAAIIKIPNGNISVDCQDQNKLNQFRGQLIGNKINLSGSTYLSIFYDVNTAGGLDKKPKILLGAWRQVLPSVFTSQL